MSFETFRGESPSEIRVCQERRCRLVSHYNSSLETLRLKYNHETIMNAIDLDHAGVAGHDLDSLAAAYERLGFTLTPRARHSGRRKPDGPVEPFGTANRCIMLRQGYLELIAIVDPNCYGNGLERFLARHPGTAHHRPLNRRRAAEPAALAASGHRHSGRRLAGASGRRRRPQRAARALRPAAAAGRARGPHTVDSPSHPRGDLAAALPRSSPTMPSPWRKWCLPWRIRRSRRRAFRCLPAVPQSPMRRRIRAELRAQPPAPAAGRSASRGIAGSKARFIAFFAADRRHHAPHRRWRGGNSPSRAGNCAPRNARRRW